MSRDILADYLAGIARIRSTLAGTGEISYYGCLAGALNAVGATLKPRVFCVPNLRNRGAGFPDMGLFAGADVGAADEWPEGRPPDRGVVEIDDIPAPLDVKLGSDQVARYFAKYGLVLVTNFRAFVLLGRDKAGQKEVREQFDFGCANAEADGACTCPSSPNFFSASQRHSSYARLGWKNPWDGLLRHWSG